VRADDDAGDGPDEQRAGEPELELSPDEVADRGGEHERNRLHEIGADQLLRRERRVEQHEGDDHERARPHGGHAHDGPTEETDGQGRCPLHRHAQCVVARDARPAAAAQVSAHEHRARGDQEHDPQDRLDGVTDVTAEVRHDVRPDQGAGHGSEGEPLHESGVHRAASEVDASSDGLHDDGGDEVARHRGQGLDAEADHQDRRHQRPTAHAGEADDDAHDEAGDGDADVDVHEWNPAKGN